MVLLAVPLLLFLLLLYWEKQHPEARTAIVSPLGYPLLFLAHGIAISSTSGIASGETIVAILFHWGAAGGVLLFLIAALLARGAPLRIFTRAVLIVSTVLLVVASITLISQWISAGTLALIHIFPRPSLIGMQPNQAAIPIYLGVPLAIGAMWRASLPWQRWAWGVWLFWATIVLFYTSSRGAWLAFFAGAGIALLPLLYTAYRAQQTKRLFSAIGLAAGYTLLFASLFLANHAMVHEQHAGRLSDNASQEQPSLSTTLKGLTHSTGRGFFWQHALVCFATKPTIGLGPGSYSLSYQQTYPERSAIYTPPHAHSVPFAVLSELGAMGSIGILIVLGFAGWVWWRGWHQISLSTQPETWYAMLMCGAAVIGGGVHALVEVPAPQNGILLLSLGVIAVAGGKAWRPKRPPRWAKSWWVHPLHVLLFLHVAAAWVVATLVFVQ
jgi:O-antigen ligase